MTRVRVTRTYEVDVEESVLEELRQTFDSRAEDVIAALYDAATRYADVGEEYDELYFVRSKDLSTESWARFNDFTEDDATLFGPVKYGCEEDEWRCEVLQIRPIRGERVQGR